MFCVTASFSFSLSKPFLHDEKHELLAKCTSTNQIKAGMCVDLKNQIAGQSYTAGDPSRPGSWESDQVDLNVKLEGHLCQDSPNNGYPESPEPCCECYKKKAKNDTGVTKTMVDAIKEANCEELKDKMKLCHNIICVREQHLSLVWFPSDQ